MPINLSCADHPAVLLVTVAHIATLSSTHLLPHSLVYVENNQNHCHHIIAIIATIAITSSVTQARDMQGRATKRRTVSAFILQRDEAMKTTAQMKFVFGKYLYIYIL